MHRKVVMRLRKVIGDPFRLVLRKKIVGWFSLWEDKVFVGPNPNHLCPCTKRHNNPQCHIRKIGKKRGTRCRQHRFQEGAKASSASFREGPRFSQNAGSVRKTNFHHSVNSMISTLQKTASSNLRNLHEIGRRADHQAYDERSVLLLLAALNTS